MKKTFLTSMTKDELSIKIKKINEKDVFPIKIIEKNRLRVSNGRATTYWKISMEEPGKITIEKDNTIWEWITILTLVVIDIVCSFLALYGKVSLNGILFIAGLILCEYLPLYYLYVLSPTKKLQEFINKHLGGC